MKKVELKGKLVLNKITISKLNDIQMNVLRGGSETEKPGEPIKGVGVIHSTAFHPSVCRCIATYTQA